MGYRLSYVATAAAPDVVAGALGLTLKPGEVDDTHCAGARLFRLVDSDRAIFLTDDAGYGGRLAELSRSAKVHGYSAVENVNANALACWQDGAPAWSITYDNDREPEFETTGSPPARFEELRSNYAAERAYDWETESSVPCTLGDHDRMFSVIDHMAEERCGYVCNSTYAPSEIAEGWIATPPRRGLLSRLFG